MSPFLAALVVFVFCNMFWICYITCYTRKASKIHAALVKTEQELKRCKMELKSARAKLGWDE